jgi:hypothetical protein
VPLTLAALAALAAAPSCSNDDDPETASLGLLLTPGRERDAWDREPAPSVVRLVAHVAEPGAAAEKEVVLAERDWPFDNLSYEGLVPGSLAYVSAEVRDASARVIMRGETPVFDIGEGFGRQLPVLVGRAGEFARATEPLAGDWPAPRAALFAGRYVLLGGGEGTGAEFFDLLTLAPRPLAAGFERPPATLLPLDAQTAIAIDAGGARTYDLSRGVDADLALPEGAAGALAGGDAVLSDAETSEAFVVGATRAGEPTASVLRISAEGVKVIKLAAPRARAGAVWVKGQGLLVVGGAEGAPAELLAPKASAFAAAKVQAPTVFEPSLVPTPGGEVLVMGGLDASGAAIGPQRLSLACFAPCPATPEAIATALPPVRAGRAFENADGRWLVVGADVEGFAAALDVNAAVAPATAAPVVPRVRRRGAAAVAAGGGYVALLGGADAAGAPVRDVELFVPPP